MSVCETCGNYYENNMSIRIAGQEHLFDCFECAIHALAPRCGNCKVPVVGHGVEVDGAVYCSAHCGRVKGGRSFRDHVVGARDNPHWSA
jgi:hypothetical protein